MIINSAIEMKLISDLIAEKTARKSLEPSEDEVLDLVSYQL
jgi:hypothetical protein